MPRRTSGPGPRSLAPKRSINCGSQWFTGSMSTCTSPFLFHTSHISPLALTGNTFLCNLPWQGENISIKQGLPRQTSLVLDNLSDRAVCLSAQLCPHVILLSVFYTLFDSLSPPPTFSACLPDRYICYSQMHVCFKVACSLSRWLCPLRPVVSVDFSGDCCALLLPHECLNHSTFTCFAHFLTFFLYLPLFCCFHRCTVLILASGWVEVSSDRQAQHHWWKRKTLTKHTRMPLWDVFMWVLMNAICLSGFNLVRRFSLLKSADVKKIRNPRGPVILRLGKTALLRPTEWVYSTHCPSPALFFPSTYRQNTSPTKTYAVAFADFLKGDRKSVV